MLINKVLTRNTHLEQLGC